mgnify:CR=1 FL=1
MRDFTCPLSHFRAILASFQGGDIKALKLISLILLNTQLIFAAAIVDKETVLWKGGIIFYKIDSGFAHTDKLQLAMEYYERNTPIKFVERTSEKLYVTFKGGSGCKANIGMPSTANAVVFSDTCTYRSYLHELGHLTGLFHEQSRKDRDRFIKINWGNINSSDRDHFKKYSTMTTPGRDFQAYDYNSIMHYEEDAFSKNGGLTIERKDGGVLNPFQDRLTTTDLKAVKYLYKAYISHSCVVLRPNRLTVSYRAPSWQVKDGNKRYFKFNQKKNALAALEVIQHFNLKYLCHTGVGQKRVSFFKNQSLNAPSGNLSFSENCTNFSNLGLDVKMYGASKIGIFDKNSNRILGFGKDVKSSYTAFRFLKDQVIRKKCLIGLKKSGFIYWKR